MSFGYFLMAADWYSCKWGYGIGLGYGRACCTSGGLLHFVVDKPPFPKKWIPISWFKEGPR